MPLMTPCKCWRGRTDCMSLASVEAIPDGTPEDQMEYLNYEPVSFVCCGIIAEAERKIEQDAFRLCFKNEATDEMTDNDEQDLSHVAYVIAQAQAVFASRNVNSGTVRVPTDDGGFKEVETKQKAD